MSILNVIARCRCDRCGYLMRVEIEAAKCVAGWSVFDLVEDALRGGNTGYGITSVQDNNVMLCPQCTLFAAIEAQEQQP